MAKKNNNNGVLQRLKRVPKIIVVAVLFGMIGAGYLLFQTFATSTSVKYWGVLTPQNPTAQYKLTTGIGDMVVVFSNNTADQAVSVQNSKNQTVGTLKSIGKRDVSITMKVAPDTYTFTVGSASGQQTSGRKGFKLAITYPVADTAKPSAVILSPLTLETVKGTVDYTVDARDDSKVSKVDMYVDDVLHASVANAPYTAKWDTTKVADGAHTLSVKAYDESGNVGIASGQVTIQNKAVSVSRFPGDPNTKISGKAYWGATGSHITEHESAVGKSVALHRSYASSWPGTTKLVNAIKDDHANNRLPWVSTKTLGWATFASGAYDAQIDQFLRDIDAAANDKPVWLTIHHEPENDSTATGEYSAAAFRGMQSKFRERMKAVGTKNIAFMPIFQGFSWQTTKWDINQFYVAGVWDAIGFDHYADSSTNNLVRDRFVKIVSWIEDKGLPYAVGEFGTRDYGNAAQEASEIKEFWNWGFDNNKDALGYAYFDSALNSPDGTWELTGPRLDAWRDILKNDTRVLRINDVQ